MMGQHARSPHGAEDTALKMRSRPRPAEAGTETMIPAIRYHVILDEAKNLLLEDPLLALRMTRSIAENHG